MALLNAPEAGSRVEDVTKVISWLGRENEVEWYYKSKSFSLEHQNTRT